MSRLEGRGLKRNLAKLDQTYTGMCYTLNTKEHYSIVCIRLSPRK